MSSGDVKLHPFDCINHGFANRFSTLCSTGRIMRPSLGPADTSDKINCQRDAGAMCSLCHELAPGTEAEYSVVARAYLRPPHPFELAHAPKADDAEPTGLITSPVMRFTLDDGRRGKYLFNVAHTSNNVVRQSQYV